MLDESETLDVFSFLSQIDLPNGLPPFEDEAHDAVAHVHEMLSKPIEFSPSVDESCSFEELFNQQTPATPDAKVEMQEESDGHTTLTARPTSSEASTQPKTEVDKKTPKRTRISRKQQIETLRGTVQELNDELQGLLPQWQPDFMLGRNGPRRGSMWQEIAERQLERREKSEKENAKLRAMLNVQIHEAKNLRRVLKRRSKIEMMEDMLGMKRQKLCDYGVPEDNPQVFEDMLRDTDELYVDTDALFVAKGLYDLPCPGRRRDATRNITDGLFLELLQRHLVPFGLRSTEKAMWKAMQQVTFQGLANVKDFADRVQFRHHHIEESSNIIKVSFFAETSDLGYIRGAQLRKVVQKYVEKDRIIFICKSLMEPILFETSKPSGFCTRTTLRVVVRQENPQATEEKAVSLIESHFSATRYDQGLPAAQDIRNSPNMDVGIAVWDEATSRIAHQVESLVIDESFDKPSTPALSIS